MPKIRTRRDTGQVDAPLIRLWGGGVRHHPSALGIHRNDGYELTFVTQGAVRWEIEGGPSLELSGGDVCLMQPRIPHRGENDIIAPCGLYWIVFDPQVPGACRNTPFTREDLARMDARFRAAGNTVFRATPELAGLVRIWADGRPGFDASDAASRAGMRALLCLFLQTAVSALGSGTKPVKSVEVGMAEVYFREHLSHPCGVGDAARHVGLSPSRFHERFRRETGKTPADYLQRLRCGRAREMLRQSDATITDIALDCGFSSSQYFAKCFRKYTGCTPGSYRRRFRG